MSLELLEEELQYEIFLADQALDESLSIYGKRLLLESDDIDVLQEGIIDSLTGYLNKIIEAIQKVWNKFIEWLEQRDQKFLKSIAKEIATAKNPNFQVNHYTRFDMNTFQTTNVVPFNYDEMKEFLTGGSKRFCNKYYPDFDMEKYDSIKKACRAHIVTSIDNNVQVTVEMLQLGYKYCTQGYQIYKEQLKEDMDSMNKSTESILNKARLVIKEAALMYYDIIMEADNNVDPNTDQGKPVAAKISDNGQDPKEKEQAKTEANQTIKNVKTYTKICTGVLSAKMEIVRDLYKENFAIVNHYVKVDRGTRHAGVEEITRKDKPNNSNVGQMLKQINV